MYLRQVEDKFQAGDVDGLASVTSEAVPHLQDLIQKVAGIINGGPDETAEESEMADDQAKVDALFD